MIKAKVAGIAMTGLAGYLLISKAISVADHGIRCLCDAIKWRAYYKYDSATGNCVAPGYCQYTRPIDDNREVVVEKDDSRNESTETPGKALADAVTKAVNEWIKDRKKPEEEAKEDKTQDPFGDTIKEIRPEEEAAAEEDQIPYECVVTETDEKGKPVAGRYPFGYTDGDTINVTQPEEKAEENTNEALD